VQNLYGDLRCTILKYNNDHRVAGKEPQENAFYETVLDVGYYDLTEEGFDCIVCVSSDGKLSLQSRMV
jgi:hypothetical protein